MYRDTSTPGEFVTKKCYRLYQEACKLALSVNDAIDAGHTATADESPLTKFTLRHEGLPVIAQINGGINWMWFGVPSEDGEKADWRGVTLKHIKQRFAEISID